MLKTERFKRLKELFDILEKITIDYIKEHPELINDIESNNIDFAFGFENVKDVINGNIGGSDVYCGFIVDNSNEYMLV